MIKFGTRQYFLDSQLFFLCVPLGKSRSISQKPAVKTSRIHKISILDIAGKLGTFVNRDRRHCSAQICSAQFNRWSCAHAQKIAKKSKLPPSEVILTSAFLLPLYSTGEYSKVIQFSSSSKNFPDNGYTLNYFFLLFFTSTVNLPPPFLTFILTVAVCPTLA